MLMFWGFIQIKGTIRIITRSITPVERKQHSLILREGTQPLKPSNNQDYRGNKARLR
jgi:hypothetical protein